MHLTPRAAERVSREGVDQASFDRAAESLNADWGTAYDGKQIQRWAEHYGRKVSVLLEAQRALYHKGAQGHRPRGPENAAQLLAVGMDGGRVQERDKDPLTQSRYREDKVATISSYIKQASEAPGEAPVPRRLVTSYVATMNNSTVFGEMARVEAERRGIREALEVVVIGEHPRRPDGCVPMRDAGGGWREVHHHLRRDFEAPCDRRGPRR